MFPEDGHCKKKKENSLDFVEANLGSVLPSIMAKCDWAFMQIAGLLGFVAVRANVSIGIFEGGILFFSNRQSYKNE